MHLFIETPRGWEWIVVALLQVAENRGIVPSQIKEKFGTLRFYYDSIDLILDKHIEYADKLAQMTCAICGKQAQTYEQFKEEMNRKYMAAICNVHG